LEEEEEENKRSARLRAMGGVGGLTGRYRRLRWWWWLPLRLRVPANACLHAALEIPQREEGEQQLLIDSRHLPM
jgi:hypothetical protein